MRNKTTQSIYVYKNTNPSQCPLRENPHRTRRVCWVCGRDSRACAHVCNDLCISFVCGISLAFASALALDSMFVHAVAPQPARRRETRQRQSTCWPDLIFKASSLELLVHNSSDRAEAYIQNTHKTKYTAAGVCFDSVCTAHSACWLGVQCILAWKLSCVICAPSGKSPFSTEIEYVNNTRMKY